MNNSERISKRMHYLLSGVFAEENYATFKESVRKQSAIGSLLNMTQYHIWKCVWYEIAQQCGFDTSEKIVNTFASAYGWMHSKVIYTFDPDIAESLRNIRWGEIRDKQVNILSQLPVDNFVVSPGYLFRFAEHNCDFFSVHVERSNKCIESLRIIFGGDDMKPNGDFKVLTFTIHLGENSHNYTFDELYKINCENIDVLDTETNIFYKNVVTDSNRSVVFSTIKKTLVLILPYLFYLCSKNAEISQTEHSKSTYTKPIGVPKDSYSEIKEYICGEPTGIRIRNFRNVQHSGSGHRSGSVKSPHVRRAHYHKFWVGSGEDRHQVIRFLPQTVIHPELIDYLKPISVKVKSS